MQHVIVLKKLNFDILTLTPVSGGWGWVGVCGQNICYHAATFCDPIYMQPDHVLKVKFWPIDPISRGGGGGRVCRQNICYHVAAFVILFNLKCNMTMFWKSNFDLLTSSQEGGGGGGGVCGQNICYHVAAFVILFNLICNMTMFWKSNFDLLTPSWGGGLRANYLLPCCCICDSL